MLMPAKSLKIGTMFKKNDSDLVPMNPYEKDVVRDVAKWKAEEPGVVSEVVGIVLTPLWILRDVA